MIYDTGVGADSEVYPAVVYQFTKIDPPCFPYDNEYRHGNQMCRYALFLAPKINIYDIRKSSSPKHMPEGVYSAQDNPYRYMMDLGADIISLSGFGIACSEDGAVEAINSGVILNTSIGNVFGRTNEIDDFLRKEKFLSYYKNLSSATGAFVTVQAMVGIDGSSTRFESIRSGLGGARTPYLCLKQAKEQLYKQRLFFPL